MTNEHKERLIREFYAIISIIEKTPPHDYLPMTLIHKNPEGKIICTMFTDFEVPLEKLPDMYKSLGEFLMNDDGEVTIEYFRMNGERKGN